MIFIISFIIRSYVFFIGWFEFFLDRIVENKFIVVCFVIDVIEDDFFKYQYGNVRVISIGGFDWNMQFNWYAIFEYERKRRSFKDYFFVRYLLFCGVRESCFLDLVLCI